MSPKPPSSGTDTASGTIAFLNNAYKLRMENCSVTNVVQNNVNNGMTGLQLLYQKTVPGAYDSPELESRSLCHPETRRAIVKDIIDWINNVNRNEDVLWLRGPAGSGKTAIAKTVCQLCHDDGSLGGSFFFLRTVPQLNNARHLITTLAHQLAVSMPEVGKRIDEIVVHNHPILDKKLKVQLQELILEPVWLTAPAACRMVIIIDGLDECSSEDKQCEIIQEIGAIFQHAGSSISLIITSRPEPWINDELQSTLSGKLHEVALEKAADTDKDIRTYLVSGFADIRSSPKHRRTMSKVPELWPSVREITDLVLRASGQFIYAATVLKFVDDPDCRPVDQLQVILATPMVVTPRNPLAELDQLYIQIMSSCKDKERTLNVLGTLLVMLRDVQFFSWVPRRDALDVTEYLLGLEPDDGYLALRRLRSLVEVSPLSPEEHESTAPYKYGSQELSAITFYHKSFSDFLLDKSRSGDYFIDSNSIHRHIAIACVGVMKTFSSQSPSTRTHYTTWGYAILHWIYHFSQSGPPTVEAMTALREFDLHKHYVLAMNLFDEENFGVVRHVFRAPNLAFRVTLKRLGLAFEKDRLNDNSPVHVDPQKARKTLDQLGALEEFTKCSISVSLMKLVLWLDKCPQRPRKFIRQCKEHARVMSPSLRRDGSRWVTTIIDQIIIIIGPVGVGKSEFISTIAETKGSSKHSLEQGTQVVHTITVANPQTKRPLTFVDTHSSDDTMQPNTENLKMIADLLLTRYQNGVELVGIIYVHPITDERMARPAPPYHTVRMFDQLCGGNASARVAFVTTMWDKLNDANIGETREKELKDNSLKEMIKKNATTHRFGNTMEDAWNIINDILKKDNKQRAEVLYPKKLVDFRRFVYGRQTNQPIDPPRISLPSLEPPIELDVAKIDRASSCA